MTSRIVVKGTKLDPTALAPVFAKVFGTTIGYEAAIVIPFLYELPKAPNPQALLNELLKEWGNDPDVYRDVAKMLSWLGVKATVQGDKVALEGDLNELKRKAEQFVRELEELVSPPITKEKLSILRVAVL